MGQYCDMESGLVYNHFRYYDPLLGRYISQDPLGMYAGMNFYIYPTNPNNWVDPNGFNANFRVSTALGALSTVVCQGENCCDEQRDASKNIT